MNPQELRERLARLNDEAHALRARAEAEKRDLSVEETEQLDAILSAFDRTKADLDRLEKLESQTAILNKPAGRKTEPATPAKLGANEEGDVEVPRPTGRREGWVVPGGRLDPVVSKNGGFKNLGEMAYHVARACVEGGSYDPRLARLAAATTWGSESVGADGGFAVPPDFQSDIMAKVLGEESLLPFCDQVTTSGNSFTMPVDETTPWQTTGGIQAFWDGEAQAATQSKPALEERTVKLNKVRALVPVTEEMLQDAPAMDAYLRRKAPEKIAFKVAVAILNTGTGVGQPLSVLNSPALVTVSKEGSQVADTLVANNVVKMWARCYGPCRQRANWFINQDIEPFLNTLSMPGRDNTGNSVSGWGFPVYLPANGISGSPFGTLYNRPVIPTQACETLGDLGDIILADLTQYLALLKSGPNPRLETSMHLWFDQDLMAFKFVLRIGGIPWWGSAISPRDGTNTLSCFVALEAR